MNNLSADVPSVPAEQNGKPIESKSRVVVRFAGDSGDGMQIVGGQFTNTSAVFGNDISTLPDFPAEIRAPAGTRAGVSGFQVNFSSHDIFTPGDELDALIAMNPAALVQNIDDLRTGGVLIVNRDDFTKTGFSKARLENDPLLSPRYENYRVHQIPITEQTKEAVASLNLSAKEAERCKNFYALGLVYWLFDRPVETTLNWIQRKWAKAPELAEANTTALRAGYNLGETAEIFPVRYRVVPAKLAPGKYRNLTGNQALAMGMIAASRQAKKPLFYGSYPITPASDVLHELARQKHFDVRTFQAEDEIAAVCSAIGASYAGALAATGSSGPGIALKQEAIGLAVMTELPLVILDVQRAGPSTGMPTKTEQSDLLQAVTGRNGDCPAAVIAPQSPADCFNAALEAFRIATKFMTPVFLLSDGYIANGAEPWPIPREADLPKLEIKHATDPATFKPYTRNDIGVRPWAIPGTPDLRHRIGGIEKSNGSGEISYDPANHAKMTALRAQKIANIANDIAEQPMPGGTTGDMLVISWGGTHGAIHSGVARVREAGHAIAHMHLRWLNPLPRNVKDIIASFDKILVCELNSGQLRLLLQGLFGKPMRSFTKVQGKPFTVGEVEEAILKELE
ncbi:MAG: 2-oxoacid:acceptor oxidoreductase subunit alpha [Phycisphaerae bacterium]